MKHLTKTIFTLAAAIFGILFFWNWGFCRFYVEPDEMAIITAKTGQSLPPGQILAKKGQQGIQEDVLAEGRYFLNPYLYAHTIVDVITIPPGKAGIVTSKVGADLPEGEFLANVGQKGIWRNVLGPGKYRLNTYGYLVEIVDAISVPIGYVGVITSLSGKQAPEGQFAEANEKGIRKDILQPGLYYINPKEFKCDVLEIGVNQVSLIGKTGGEVIAKQQMVSQNAAMGQLERKVLDEQKEKRSEYMSQQRGLSSDKTYSSSGGGYATQAPDAVREKAAAAKPFTPADNSAMLSLNQFVEFPSRDGFEISLDMTVEFELLPQNIASIYKRYGDLPAVVDKIIMPQILSVSRLKGSAYRAIDFIVGEGREKFQTDLTDALAKTLTEKEIIIHNALIRHVNGPVQILDPIQQASIAVEQDLTNKEKQNTAKKQAELNTESSLIEQRREQVAQETEKMKAEIKADQEKQVAETQANALKSVAEIEKQTAQVRAEKTRKLGEANAQVISLVEGERAKGFELKAKAFGDPVAYSMWEFANQLNENIKINILHSGPGTLWTDIEKASLSELGGAAVIQQAK